MDRDTRLALWSWWLDSEVPGWESYTMNLSHCPSQRETRRTSLALATANEINWIPLPFWKKTGQAFGTWRQTCVATLPKDARRGQRVGQSLGALSAQLQRWVCAVSDVCWCRGARSGWTGAQAEAWQPPQFVSAVCLRPGSPKSICCLGFFSH